MKTIQENGLTLKISEKRDFLLSYKPNNLRVVCTEPKRTSSVDLYRSMMFWMKENSMDSKVLTVRKKPVEVQAVLFDGSKESLDVINSDKFKGQSTRRIELQEDGTLAIHTLEGVMRASIGDYIIKGVNGELYPCKPDIFKKTYDVVDNKLI